MRKIAILLLTTVVAVAALAQGYRVVVVPDGVDPNDLFSSKSALTNAALIESTANAVLLSNGMLYVTMNTNLSLEAVLATGNDGGGEQIKNIADPTAAQDAATKSYIDNNYIASGGGALTNYFYANQFNSTQTVSQNVLTKANVTNEIYDTKGVYNATNSRFTATATETWMFTGYVSSDDKTTAWSIFVNGTQYMEFNSAFAAGQVGGGFVLVECTNGTYVELYGQAGGGSAPYRFNDTIFTGVQIK